MFKRLSTISTRKSTKTVVNEAPVKAEEEVPQPHVEEKEPVSESRGEDAPRDGETRDLRQEVLEYTLEGPEGDAIDQVFGTVEEMVCAPIAPPAPATEKCQITKFTQNEKIGLSLRTSITTNGLYVSKITSGSKFEATALEVGQKVLKINGADCPEKLDDAIGMLKQAESAVVLEVGPNDEAAKKIDEMGEMSNDLVVKNNQLTEIAVDGFADTCGFFWSLQNGFSAFEAKAEEHVEENPKEGSESDAIDQIFGTAETIICGPEETDPAAGAVKAIEAKAEEQVEEAPKEEEEATKPEEDKVEKSPKSKKKISFKKPTLPSAKAPTLKAPSIRAPKLKSPTFKGPSMPSFKFSKKSKKVEEKETPAAETIHGEDGMVTIKLTKGSKDESVGLALRNSVSNDNVYVYGIFEGSKLKNSGLGVNMRVHSVNGIVYTDVEEAVKNLKESTSLELVAGPNDEPAIADTDVESEESKEEGEQQEQTEAVEGETSASWFW